MPKSPPPSGANWSRRSFLRSIGLGGAAAGTAGAPLGLQAATPGTNSHAPAAGGRAKNVLMFVSDGMNIGTLSLADLYSRAYLGKPDAWIQLYQQHAGLVSRGLMNTASANSPVTDSAAVCTAWSTGQRVNNGSVNFDPDGNRLTPLFETLKAAGKATALVTTARVTHATPAGFAAAVRDRNAENHIAPQYRELGVDVILGGGTRFFDPGKRPDEVDLIARYKTDGYQFIANRTDLLAASSTDRVLGLFSDDHLPYHIDWLHSGELQKQVPTLAEMTRKAIGFLTPRPEGFVMQIEAARVDHAGHHNDIGAIIHDQLAFSEALEEGLRFAAGRDDTLVIVTTDHGCGGPNLNGLGPKYADSGDWFSHVRGVRRSLQSIVERLLRHEGDFGNESAQLAATSLGMDLTAEQNRDLLARLNAMQPNQRLNEEHQIHLLAAFHSPTCGVSWNSQQHTGEMVEIAAIGPGREALPPFIDNTFIRPWILSACGIA